MDIKRLSGVPNPGSPTAPVSTAPKQDGTAPSSWLADDYLPTASARLQEAIPPTVQPNHDPEPSERPAPQLKQSTSKAPAGGPAIRTESAPTFLNIFDETNPDVAVDPTPKTSQSPQNGTEKTAEQPAAKTTAPTPDMNIPKSSVSTSVNPFRKMGNSVLNLFGKGDATIVMRPTLQEVNALEPKMRALSDTQLKAKTTEFKARLAAGETLDQLMPEAFAAVREAARRVNGTRPFDVQILGAMALAQGKIAEMGTGEGKTLTAVMPVYLNALTGKGAQVVTVNDTLAQRDCKQMGPIYNFMGLTTGVVIEQMSTENKKKGYQADVTYTTNASLGFDYLRDNMAKDTSQIVQREPNYAVVDEVDEILIDEARTPLIVSELSEPSKALYSKFSDIVTKLVPGDDYKVDRKEHSAWLTDAGQDKVEKEIGLDMYAMVDNKMLDDEVQSTLQSGQPVVIDFGSKQEADAYLPMLAAKKIPVTQARTGTAINPAPGSVALLYPEGPVLKKGPKPTTPPVKEEAHTPAARLKAESYNHMDMVNFLQSALKAHTLFTRDKDYIVENGKVNIVDEFTGRVMDGRRYNDGIHQALEAKEGVEVQSEQKTMASITYPNLFRRYPKLAGMSGTAKTEEKEFEQLYGLQVATIPPNRPSQRKDLPDMIYKTADEKFKAIADEVQRLYEDGQPVLVGTRSIGVNQYLDRLLAERGIPHQVLNAKSVKDNTQSENDTLALAGKSGMVTIATNMAGRGVDIKPDQVNFKKMTGEILGRLQSGQPVGVALDKKADAESLLSWLVYNDVPVVTSPTTSEGQLEPGKITLMYPGSQAGDLDATIAKLKGEVAARAQEEAEARAAEAKASGVPETPQPSQPAPQSPAPTPQPGVIIQAKDFASGGLYVLGTERHESRRIDNQLRGRSARQGEPGTTRFYGSLDDELMRYFGGDKLKTVFGRLGIGTGQALSDKMVDNAIERAQQKVESANFDMRTNTTKYDGILNIHRKIIYEERKKILEGTDLKADVLNWADNKIDELAKDIKVKRGKVSPDDARLLTDQVKEFFGMSDNMEPQALNDEKPEMPKLLMELKAAMRSVYFQRENMLTHEGMEQLSKESMLNAIDDEWHMHLDNMSDLQQGIGWVAMAQKDPEQEYAKQGFEMFQNMKYAIEDRAMEDIFKVPLIANNPIANNVPPSLQGLRLEPVKLSDLQMFKQPMGKPGAGGFLSAANLGSVDAPAVDPKS